MIRRRRNLGPLSLTGLLAACGAMRSTAEVPSLDGTAWVLAELPGRSLLEKTSVTLHFEAGRISGSDGCNRFGGSYSASDPALEISPHLAMTMMACPADVSEQAQTFIAALQGARSFRISEGRLTLRSADGSTLATLAAQSQALAGTSWQVTGLNNGRHAVVSLVADSSVTLAFGSDGSASGSAGCNRFTTRFESEGSKLTFQPPAATRKLCAQPEGLMEQEQQFLTALATVTSARFEGDRLELRSADGALALTLARHTGG